MKLFQDSHCPTYNLCLSLYVSVCVCLRLYSTLTTKLYRNSSKEDTTTNPTKLQDVHEDDNNEYDDSKNEDDNVNHDGKQ